MPSRKKRTREITRLNERLESLTIEWCDSDKLNPNPWNPNRQNEHEFNMLVKSIEDAGFTQPIMVVEITLEHEVEWATEIGSGYEYGDLVIVDGEHRWRAAQALGMTTVPIVKMPYGAVQAKLSTLQMNRARGSEDIELATEVLRDLERLGVLEWAGDRLDMTDAELSRLLTDIPEPDVAPASDGDQPDADSATPAALRHEREGEERLRLAKREEDRAAWKRESNTFRLILTFAGEEADVVKLALGDQPAVKVLEWCRARQPVAELPPAV
jgi:ParB-like chromosome segregation protein Spo0J